MTSIEYLFCIFSNSVYKFSYFVKQESSVIDAKFESGLTGVEVEQAMEVLVTGNSLQYRDYLFTGLHSHLVSFKLLHGLPLNLPTDNSVIPQIEQITEQAWSQLMDGEWLLHLL